MDIPVEAEVECATGPCGRSTGVVLKPATEEITHVVVREKQAPHGEVLVPVDYIIENAPDFLRLRCTSTELSRLQRFVSTEFVEVDIPRYTGDLYTMHPYTRVREPTMVTVKHESIPGGELAVRTGARVEATDGTVGQVDEFLVKPGTDQITHIVLREGHLWGQKEVAIPVSKIEQYRDGAVFLTIDKKEVAGLPGIAMRRRPLAIPTSVELRCRAEPCGYLTYYVLDPNALRVSHVVARPAGRSYLQYMVPVRLVTATEPGLVELDCEGDALAAMEPFVDTVYVREDLLAPESALAGQPLPDFETEASYSLEPLEVATDRQRVPPGEIAVCPGTAVRATDGPIGKMDGLLMEPRSGKITQLVLRKGHIWGQRDIMIPATEIDRFAEDAVYLTVDRHGLSKLPGVAVQRRP